MTVSITCRAWNVKPVSPAWSISCERTTTTCAPSSFFASFDGWRLSSSSSARSTSFGTRAAASFFRRGEVGQEASSMRAPSLPSCSTTEKLADAPGWSAAMPMGVMLGSAPTAGAHGDLGGLRQPLGELDAHLEAHGVDEEVGDGLGLVGDDLAPDARLVERAGHGPPGLHERLGEALGHRVAGVLVGAPDDAERALLGLLVEVRDPGLEAALGLVEAEPAVLRRVGVEPRGGVARGLADGRSHLHRDAAQLGHAASGLPLGLPLDVTVKPEALLSRPRRARAPRRTCRSR